jgi:hypothetical protein
MSDERKDLEAEKAMYNEKRCLAAEIIVQLFKAGEINQVHLLKLQIDQTLKELQKKGLKSTLGENENV